jgi:hypothetical protein
MVRAVVGRWRTSKSLVSYLSISSTRVLTFEVCDKSSLQGLICQWHTHRSSSDDSRTGRLIGTFRKFKNMFINILTGDDHINPRKILERKYVYISLLAMRWRTLRLQAMKAKLDSIELDDPPLNMNSRNNITRQENELLYEQAISDLDQQKIYTKSNVDLRRLVQQDLNEQLFDIFCAFQKVDTMLGLKMSGEPHHPSGAQIRHPFDLSTDWAVFTNILHDQYNETCRDVVASATDGGTYVESRNVATFHTLKKRAIATLLEYHGVSSHYFSDLTSGESPIENAFGIDVTNLQESRIHLLRRYQTINMVRSILLRRELGYSVLALNSEIPHGGRGVYIDGYAMAGSLIAFQPGDVWPKEHLLTKAPDVVAHFAADDDENYQISVRFDEYVIDARKSASTTLCGPDVPCNPWALGHMINHPIPNNLPNCQSTMLNYTDSVMTRLRNQSHFDRPLPVSYIPNSYARSPTWQSRFFDHEPVLMHGSCLLSRRDVANEELFYDYRLQSNTTPDWYEPVVYGNEMDDDDKIVFFRDDWQQRK